MKNLFNFRILKIWFLILIEIIKRNFVGIIIGIISILLIIFAQAKFQAFYNPNTITLGFIGTYQEHDLPQEVTRPSDRL